MEHVIHIGIILTVQLLIVAGFGQVSSQKLHRLSCRKEATFRANGTGFMVQASASKIISASYTPLLSRCARRCIRTGDCKSLLHKGKYVMATDGNCQILRVEKMNLTDDNIEMSMEWKFYELLRQVGASSHFGIDSD